MLPRSMHHLLMYTTFIRLLLSSLLLYQLMLLKSIGQMGVNYSSKFYFSKIIQLSPIIKFLSFGSKWVQVLF
uniref:Uncharacterized protein n=1 Tax=Rhizophora mucronata TaxID=61149 RepID=A0A2P2LSU4_RHIMU